MKKTSNCTLLKISELARESGFPISTIRHYINEGLLGDPKKTSKNMAWYDPESVPRISLIKRMQEELNLPLKFIKKLLKPGAELSFGDYLRCLEIRDRLEEYGDLLPKISSIPHGEAAEHLNITEEEFSSMEQKGVISPDIRDGEKFYDESDLRVLKSYSDCRSQGFSDEAGFGAHDLDVYTKHIRDLVQSETRVFVGRVAPGLSGREIADLLQQGLPAINELIGSLHHKIVLEVLGELLGSGEGGEPED